MLAGSRTRRVQKPGAMSKAQNPSIDRLFDEACRELKRPAHLHLQREDTENLQATPLVPDVCLRLAGGAEPGASEAQRLNLARRAMRQIRVDVARVLAADQRGGGAIRVTQTACDDTSEHDVFELLALGLQRQNALPPRLGQAVEMHFFGGARLTETARDAICAKFEGMP